MECEHRLWVSHLVKQIIHIWDKSVVLISWIMIYGHTFFDYEYVILIASLWWLFSVYKCLLLNIIWFKWWCNFKVFDTCWVMSIKKRFHVMKFLNLQDIWSCMMPWQSLQNNVWDTMKFWRFMLMDFEYIWMCCKFINIR